MPGLSDLDDNTTSHVSSYLVSLGAVYDEMSAGMRLRATSRRLRSCVSTSTGFLASQQVRELYHDLAIGLPLKNAEMHQFNNLETVGTTLCTCSHFLNPYHQQQDLLQVCQTITGPSAESQTILRGYVRGINLQGELCEAMGELMQVFRLPGESSRLDRTVEAFTGEWFQRNQHDAQVCPFASADGAYVLTVCLFMLNTNSFNPNCKHKLTLDQFARNLRGINNGADLPREYLVRVFTWVREGGLRQYWQGNGAPVPTVPLAQPEAACWPTRGVQSWSCVVM